MNSYQNNEQDNKDNKQVNLNTGLTLALTATTTYLSVPTSLFGLRGNYRAQRIKKVLEHPKTNTHELTKLVVFLAIFNNEGLFFSSKKLIPSIVNHWITGEYVTYQRSSFNTNTLQSEVFSEDLLDETKSTCMVPTGQSYDGRVFSCTFDKKLSIQYLLNTFLDANYKEKRPLIEKYSKKLYGFFEGTEEEKLSYLLIFPDSKYAVARADGALTTILPRLPQGLHTHIGLFFTERDIVRLKRVSTAANNNSKQIEEAAKKGKLYF